MLKKFKIKKHTKYEIISYICLMVSYAIVTYILSIKNNPNKIKLFHTKKNDVNISFEFLCNNHSVNDFDV